MRRGDGHFKRVVALALAATLLSAAGAGAAAVDGTGGNDFLVGTPGADSIRALGGHDTVLGLGGRDRIRGGAGDDRIEGEGSCPPDRESPAYCLPSGGTAADSDTIDGENGDDTIAGGRGADTLRGGPGDDSIDGGAKADHIVGGRGNDDIRGGRGNDRIETRDGQVDAVSCGTGRDRVIADAIDDIARNCERVSRRHGKR
jgi:Ca2+-binding RTX toxin-like protein